MDKQCDHSIYAKIFFTTIMHMMLLILICFGAFTSAHVVIPDIAGMIHPSISSTSRHVQFGDLNSPSPTAYEFLAPSPDSVVCDAQLCLQVKISSKFKTDPFFLHQYDSTYPLVSATFDSHDPTNILPLIPGDATIWWFQSNATVTGPEVDILLRIRQRSQRLAARDQILLVVRVQLLDQHSISSSIEAYSVYGNQRVTHTTRRVDGNTIQVAISITRNAEKRDVTLLDAYPLVSRAETDLSSLTGNSCDDCDEFLDACRDSEPCQTIVLPCLITQLKIIATGESEHYDSSRDTNVVDAGSLEAGDGGSIDRSESSGDLETWYADFHSVDQNESTTESTEANTNGKQELDFLQPLATCVGDLPLESWAPLRRALFCLAHSDCSLGVVQGNNAGDVVPTVFRFINGSQKFSVTSTTSGVDNVDLTILKRDIRANVTSQESFSYSASASYLGIFLQSFVLSQASRVSIVVEPDTENLDTLQLTLTYSDALMLHTLSFYKTTGELTMVETNLPRAIIEYPASSSRPALGIIINLLQARVEPEPRDDSSWTLADDCVACNAHLFGCTLENISNKSCNYNAAVSKFGKCIRQELPPSLYEALLAGSNNQRPVDAEITRCMSGASSNTDAIAMILDKGSSLACFTATRCPFGPIASVKESQMIVLETSSYIHLIRISQTASTGPASIKIKYSVGGILIATTTPIDASGPEPQIKSVIDAALVSTGIIGVVSSSKSNAGSEWTLEIIYHHVFLPSVFTIEAMIHDNSIKADDIKQVTMKGGSAQLRVVPRDSSKIFTQATTPATTSSTSTDSTPTTVPSTNPASSTASSRVATLLTTDTCYKCQTALTRCQENNDCAAFSHNQLISQLRANMPSAEANANDPTRLEIDLVHVLRSFPSTSFATPEAWHAFLGELNCLGQHLCETGYQRSSNYQPSLISVGKIALIYRVRTFADTQWKVTVAGNEFSYIPETNIATSLNASILAFQHWIKELSRTVPFELVVRVVDWDGIAISDSGSFDVSFYGGYDKVIGRYTMLAPWLTPVFEVVGGTETGGVDNIQYAGTSYTWWDIKLWSVGQSPQYDKFLDLLEIGLGRATTTPTPSSTEISSTDPCRKCASTLFRCQHNTECLSLTQNAFIPVLTTFQQSIPTFVVDNYGTAGFKIDLYPLVFPLMSGYNNSQSGSFEIPSETAWDLLAGELFCLAYGSCDMEYSDIAVDDTIHVPVNLDLVRSSVNVELCTYSDTMWDLYFGSQVFSYRPSNDISGSIGDSSLQLQKWLEALGTKDSLNLEIQVKSRVIDADTNTATLSIRIFGSYDDELCQYLMVNPFKIPYFTAVGGSNNLLAQANVFWPSMVISSTGQKPQYNKMLNMLSNGIDDTISATTPVPTPTSGSRLMSSGDPCLQCSTNIALCRDNDDCLVSSRDTLVPLLRNYEMAVSTRAETDYGSARVSLNMTELLHSLASLAEQAFLTRSGWKLFANELACIETSCDLEYADVYSPFLEFHEPTHLNINEESIFLSVRTYADTAWNMWFNGEMLSYTPDANDPMTIDDAAVALQVWIETQLSESDFVIDRKQPDIDSVAGAATIHISFHEAPNLMAPPWLIPRFEVAGGTSGGENTGLPVAKAEVTLWDIAMVSVYQIPQYGKFLDLLEFGLPP